MTATCAVDGCRKPVRARGWCTTHYSRWSKHGDPTKLVHFRIDVCEAPDCDKLANAGRYCGMHRSRLLRTGILGLRPRRRGDGCSTCNPEEPDGSR